MVNEIKMKSPRETAQEAKAAFREVSSFIERHTSALCPSCENVCCIDRHGSYGRDDMLFLRALGEGPQVRAPREKETDPCRFLTTKGCALPRWRRPFRCTWYFCGPLIEAMPREDPRQYREFIKALNRLLALRQEAIGLSP
jgi:hypothetical protein